MCVIRETPKGALCSIWEQKENEWNECEVKLLYGLKVLGPMKGGRRRIKSREGCAKSLGNPEI
jgi:hypothetical protein